MHVGTCTTKEASFAYVLKSPGSEECFDCVGSINHLEEMNQVQRFFYSGWERYRKTHVWSSDNMVVSTDSFQNIEIRSVIFFQFKPIFTSVSTIKLKTFFHYKMCQQSNKSVPPSIPTRSMVLSSPNSDVVGRIQGKSMIHRVMDCIFVSLTFRIH